MRVLLPTVLCLALAPCAVAATVGETFERLQGKLRLAIAEALAEAKLMDRAKAAAEAAAESHPELAAKAKALTEAIAEAETETEKKFPKAPEAYRQAAKEARDTGRPIFLMVGKKSDGNVVYTLRALGRLGSLRRRLVEVHLAEETEPMRALLSELAKGRDLRIPPYIFYLSPDEEVLAYSSGAQGTDPLRQKFQAALEKTGADGDPRRLARIVQALEEANEDMDQGRPGRAWPRYQAIAEVDSQAPPVEEARASLAIIDAVGKELLKAARGHMEEEDFGQAVPLLALLSRRFEGTETGEAAAAELARLKDTPQAQAVIEKLVHALQPEEPTTERPEPQEPEPKAETSPAQAAEAKAQRMLRLARNFLANDMADKAKPYLRRVLRLYPKTEASIVAQELLDRME